MYTGEIVLKTSAKGCEEYRSSALIIKASIDINGRVLNIFRLNKNKNKQD